MIALLRKYLTALSVSMVVTLSPPSQAASPINHIEIQGNTKTVNSIILQELLFTPGESPTKQELAISQQAIMDLGLFEFVKFEHEGQTLTITLKEKKHDWYILPRINRNGDGDITLGAAWQANNLNGRNQKMKLTLLHKEFEEASKDKEIQLGWRYSYPRIAGTPFSASVYSKLLNVGLDESRGNLSGRYERDHFAAGFRIGRWFSKHGLSKGLHIEIGANYARYEHQHLGGDANLYFDANVVSAVARVEWVDVADLLYSRQGVAYGIEVESANQSWGSDADFTHTTAYYRRYMPLRYREHANFNYQVTLASGDQSVFGDPIYELSGKRSIRGIPREKLEGDAFFLVNTEYLTPLFGKEKIRGGLIFDFGNAYESIEDVADLDFEYGYGLGLRWQLKSWVNTEIRLDIARGSGEFGETKVYLATNSYF